MSRWRAFRPAPTTVNVMVHAPLGIEGPAPDGGAEFLTEAARRRAALDAAAWLLLHTDEPTADVLDGYLVEVTR